MKHEVSQKQRKLGFGAGLLLSVFGRKPRPHSAAELYKKDFHPNTQKMGLRFSDRMRKVFRRQWLRLK
ncbi:MAG: hypothetical protein DRP56_01680 [Planctomycetota bacterium]|nr:MAG: hypothetical protein DRP56_01680 [Planctomycetota bacterium]RKY13957.1 MAG: hypothetical protein DRP52_01355 [Planctomycetota bacterium]